MLRSKNNKPVVTLTIRDRTLSTNKSASSKDPSFISIFNRRISNIKRNVYQLDTENSEFYQSYSLSKSYLKYKDPFEDIKKAYNDKGYKIPNLSESHNLFKPTPLLMEKKDIDMYFKNNALHSNKSEKLIKQSMIMASKSKKYLIHLKREVHSNEDEKKKLSRRINIKFDEVSLNDKLLLKQQEEEFDKIEKRRIHKFERLKEYMRFKKNKRENLQLTEYNKKIRKIIPGQTRKDSDIQKNNKMN